MPGLAPSDHWSAPLGSTLCQPPAATSIGNLHLTNRTPTTPVILPLPAAMRQYFANETKHGYPSKLVYPTLIHSKNLTNVSKSKQASKQFVAYKLKTTGVILNR
ncbi:hypothetical protein M0802_000390 [Mischocyttarus mexicanus]|nr:hypothetical protein M0802_000390 [Mischocyttarus mexicanus]